MTRTLVAAMAALMLAAGCGGGGADYDERGLLRGRDDGRDFTRAAQLYFRGNLSDAREILTGFGERYPDSPLAEDASLALRRIESDLSGSASPDTLAGSPDVPGVTLVSRPGLSSAAGRVASALEGRGFETSLMEDQGAPEITLVLYTEGFGEDAGEVTGALEELLAQPETVPSQPAGELAEMVAPGFSGVILVVGSDAATTEGGVR
jgi:hypothetical protein